MYYLQTRYYDPELGRFISADDVSYLDPESISGLNLYAYCNNNPIMYVDPTGYSWETVLGWLLSAYIAVTAVAFIAIGTILSGGLLSAVLVGAGVGALVGMGGSIISQGGFASADPLRVAAAGGIGAVIGAASGAVSYGMGIVGSYIGKSLGTVFGNAAHITSGIRFGKIFGASNLIAIGNFFGSVLGGIIGGTGANYFANKLFGEELSYQEMIKQGIEGEIPMWIVTILKWLE